MKLLAVAFVLLAGLTATSAPPDPLDPNAKINFAKKYIQINDTKVHVEIANNNIQRERGLMFRNQLLDGDGMLFIFPMPKPQSFWMKNTFIDLAIGFFDQKKVLIDIKEMKASTSEMDANPPVYNSRGPAKYALEVPKGWFSKHKINLGDKLVLVGGD